ncbi:mitochondrial ribonuclease P catalytic subunit isoform X2 [Venturia canescens]|uniref:mitochondrial ribonuclease P catalytic subunit isoform X2 n=1 Tax=Venturia canescens TaxID=32260 RepID=UPI001C9C5CD7|nr:mitochondrial ribonuclease P catalytic subunit isoform X2 [Venturia canescens]
MEVLDASTAEYCILGISKTHRWKEALELCEMIKLSCSPRTQSFSAIISAAFRNNEPEIAWTYLEDAFSRIHPEHHVFIAHTEYCKRNFKGEELEKELEKMFLIWSKYDYRPFVDIVQAYEEIFKTLGWIIERTSIRNVGICRSCDHKLSKCKISNEEFSKLAELVWERVIISGDIYKKSTPKELNYFLQFVEKNKPWDIVIDGLNVSYLSKEVRKSSGHLVTAAVNLCAKEMNKKVLLFGRNHMKKWANMDLSYIQHHADIFFTTNRSADDPYLLYATLCSGPSTMFVSRDLMRQHVARLEDPDMGSIFKKWQMTHQLRPVAITSKQGNVDLKIEYPPKYSPFIQNDENGWHIPFTFEPSLKPAVDYEPPKSWFCFRKTINTVKSTDLSLP